MNQKYTHILHMPHPTSATRPRMSQSRRAAQFAPFAALTGFEAAVEETARTTEREIYLDESEKACINACLVQLQGKIAQRPAVFVTYFVPDERKSGGSYRNIHTRVVKIDENDQKMVTERGEIIQFSEIVRLVLSEITG